MVQFFRRIPREVPEPIYELICMDKTENTMELTKKAHAYTPGLKVKKGLTIRKTRILPILGEVLVKEKEIVDFETIVAKTSVPGKPNIIKAYQILNIAPENILPFMLKKEGDKVEEDEIIAKYTPFWGLIKKFVKSPTNGIIEIISDITGQVIVREPPIQVSIISYIPGTIVDVLPEKGVIIESYGAFIQCIFGIGGEKNGRLSIIAENPDNILSADKLIPEYKDKIIVGGSLVTLNALRKAEKLGIKGIIVGGIRGVDLSAFLGYELGVAITGHEEIGLTLIVTEGFGKMTMSSRVFNLLREFEGYLVAINGATQIRAGVIRPEIFIPHDKPVADIGEELAKGMMSGTKVRIIREPYFGKIGTVKSLPVHLQEIDTMSKVRIIEVTIDEKDVIVPRANVEIIEE